MREPRRYRPDLDGLRAISVLLVVIYHASPNIVPGGFIGVDVFFVISGYFMATVIAEEIAQKRFSFTRFYARRIRRIFPALFATLIATSILAWQFLMPAEMESFARSARAVGLLVPNIHFAQESGYFDLDAHMKPLLHIWSLGVEEQFYVVFPIALVLLMRFASGNVGAVLIGAAAISFASSIYAVWAMPTWAFFALPFRLWELLTGALVALVPIRYSNAAAERLFLLGILGIGSGAFLVTHESAFPGVWALLPCVSAALVISSGKQSKFAAALLGTGPLVVVGRSSYSIYLWHWPFIVFFPYLFHVNGWTSSVLVILGSLACGIISWRLIENPFRSGAANLRPTSVILLFLSCMTLVVAASEYVIATGGLPDRIPEAARRVYAAKLEANPFNERRCFTDTDGDGLTLEQITRGQLCRLGVVDGDPTFLLWGDSHAAAIAPALDAAAFKHGMSGMFVGRGACPPLPQTDFGSAAHVARCVDFNNAVVELVKNSRFEAVFMAAYWPKYFHRNELPNAGISFDPNKPVPMEDWSAPVVAGLTETLRTISGTNAKPVLVLDVPEMGFDVPEKLARQIMVNGTLDIAPPLPYTMRRQELSRRLLTERVVASGGYIVDPLPALCDETRCNTIINDTVLYKDTDHLSTSGSLILAPIFDEVLGRWRRLNRS